MPPKAKAKKKNGYQMPEEFHEGYVLKDIYKKPWSLGKPIGQGGFGLIYTANRGECKVNQAEAEFVVKIEPKDNGPLFCETHFYVNCAKEEDIKDFKKSKSLKHLAMPKYVSSGTCIYNEKEYRFLIMDRYKSDLQSILNKISNHRISEVASLSLMRQILYTLEYIHERGYAHGDIKGANLMLKNDNESYLVDFGLAFRFMRDDIHQKYDIKPERRHNGTIEYTSRDAHDGAQINRRSDLEILAYCIIHWVSGTLPWIDLIKNSEQVQQSKIKYMKNIKEFIQITLGSVNASDVFKNFIEFYLKEINKLKFDDQPPYSNIQIKINETLVSLGHNNGLIDNFYLFNPSNSKTKASASNQNNLISLSDVQIDSPASKKRTKKNIMKDNSSTESLEDSNKNFEIYKNESESKNKVNGTKSIVKNNKTIEKDHSKNDLFKDDENEEDSLFKEKGTKKSRFLMIDADLEIKNSKKIEETISPKKSTRINSELKKEIASETNSTKFKISSRISSQIQEQEKKDNGNSIPEIQEFGELSTPHSSSYKFRLSPLREIETDSAKNLAQLDILKKLKTSKSGKEDNHLKSPLTFSINDSINVPILIKKKKNVEKATVSTQTENSYLRTKVTNKF